MLATFGIDVKTNFLPREYSEVSTSVHQVPELEPVPQLLLHCLMMGEESAILFHLLLLLKTLL